MNGAAMGQIPRSTEPMYSLNRTQQLTAQNTLSPVYSDTTQLNSTPS